MSARAVGAAIVQERDLESADGQPRGMQALDPHLDGLVHIPGADPGQGGRMGTALSRQPPRQCIAEVRPLVSTCVGEQDGQCLPPLSQGPPFHQAWTA